MSRAARVHRNKRDVASIDGKVPIGNQQSDDVWQSRPPRAPAHRSLGYEAPSQLNTSGTCESAGPLPLESAEADKRKPPAQNQAEDSCGAGGVSLFHRPSIVSGSATSRHRTCVGSARRNSPKEKRELVHILIEGPPGQSRLGPTSRVRGRRAGPEHPPFSRGLACASSSGGI